MAKNDDKKNEDKTTPPTPAAIAPAPKRLVIVTLIKDHRVDGTLHKKDAQLTVSAATATAWAGKKICADRFTDA